MINIFSLYYTRRSSVMMMDHSTLLFTSICLFVLSILAIGAFIYYKLTKRQRKIFRLLHLDILSIIFFLLSIAAFLISFSPVCIEKTVYEYCMTVELLEQEKTAIEGPKKWIEFKTKSLDKKISKYHKKIDDLMKFVE
jgi:hypothetical protein